MPPTRQEQKTSALLVMRERRFSALNVQGRVAMPRCLGGGGGLERSPDFGQFSVERSKPGEEQHDAGAEDREQPGGQEHRLHAVMLGEDTPGKRPHGIQGPADQKSVRIYAALQSVGNEFAVQGRTQGAEEGPAGSRSQQCRQSDRIAPS